MRLQRSLLYSLTLLLILTAPACSLLNKGGSGNSIEGTWISEDSSFKLVIELKGNTAKVSSWDLDDGEKFEVSKIDWDGEVLKAKFRMPSTDWVTYSVFRLVGPNTLQELYTGDSDGEVTYHRQ